MLFRSESPVVEHAKQWNIFDLGTYPVLGWAVAWLTDDPDAPEPASLELHAGVNDWDPADGEQHAELDSDWQGPGGSTGEPASVAISQSIPTIAGKTYTLSWQFSARPKTGADENVLEVLVDGDLLSTMTADGTGASNTQWELGTTSFTGTGEDMTITFRDAGTPNSEGTLLDAVALYCGQSDDDDDDHDNGDDGDNGGDDGGQNGDPTDGDGAGSNDDESSDDGPTYGQRFPGRLGGDGGSGGGNPLGIPDPEELIGSSEIGQGGDFPGIVQGIQDSQVTAVPAGGWGPNAGAGGSSMLDRTALGSLLALLIGLLFVRRIAPQR